LFELDDPLPFLAGSVGLLFKKIRARSIF
jgi:hypothetical protein